MFSSKMMRRILAKSMSELQSATYKADRPNICQMTRKTISLWGTSSNSDWKSTVSEAEKVVGYSTSYLNLRCLLSDEISNVALQVRKLVGTQHPLLQTAKHLLYDGKHGLQTRGLIILLISKAAGLGKHELIDGVNHEETVAGITHGQRQLAEIIEVIHTAYLVHKGVVDIDSLPHDVGPPSDMEFGNKMAILSGDFLLANASTGLAKLRNTKVVEIISESIGHMMEAEFMVDRNLLNRPLPTPGFTVEDWFQCTYCSAGSLLANGCSAAMMLVGHNEETQKLARDFGENMAYVLQLHMDLLPFTSHEGVVSAHSLPYIFYSQSSEDVPTPDSVSDYKQLSSKIASSSAVTRTKHLCSERAEQALNALRCFPHSEARTALEKIVNLMCKF